MQRLVLKAFAVSVVFALLACGGGGGSGGGDTPAQPPAQSPASSSPSGNSSSGNPPANNPAALVKTWKTTTVHGSSSLVPSWVSGSLSPSRVEWFRSPNPLVVGSADFVEGTGWQDHGVFVSANPTSFTFLSQVARAGDWTAIAWNGFNAAAVRSE